MIYQLNPTIDVSTPLGDCEALFLIDYGVNVNTVWVCRMPGGEVKHFYSDDIKVYGNPMNGSGWDLEWPVRETSPEFEGPIERFPPGFKEAMQDKFDREGSPEELPKGTQDPKGLQEAYEKALKCDTYNPERLPEDGGRNRKKWDSICMMYASPLIGGMLCDFLDKMFQAPKCYNPDTWTKVYNWYVSLSQYKGNSFLDFLIEFYPAPDPKR